MPLTPIYRECCEEVREVLVNHGSRARFYDVASHGSSDLFVLDFASGVLVTGAGASRGIPAPLLAAYDIIPLMGEGLHTNGVVVYRDDPEDDARKVFVEVMARIVADVPLQHYWGLHNA